LSQTHSRLRTWMFIGNATATMLLFAALLLGWVWPQYLGKLHLNAQSIQMLSLNLISFILLMAWLQRNLKMTWRIFALAGAFLVLVESWLIALV
jgi:hypothetical protein